MAHFNRLKIRTKLLLSFSVVLIITSIIGLNGLSTAIDLRNNYRQFYEEGFQPNMLISEIQLNQEKATTEMQRILYKAEIVSDEDVIGTSVEVLNELTARNDQLLQQYEANNLLPEEKELLEKVKTANTNYRTSRNEVIEAAKSGDFALAVQLNDEARQFREEVSDLLEQMKEVNNQAALELLEANEVEFNDSWSTAIALLISALLVGIGFTVLLSSNLAKPIKTLEEQAKLMAGGDFTSELPESIYRRKDELGVMANAFAEMNKQIRAMLREVADSVEETSASSEELSATVEESAPKVKASLLLLSRSLQGWKKSVLL